MVYAALADSRGQNIRKSHNRMLRDWYDSHGKALSIALTDTFNTDFFFSDFTPEQAHDWRGLRHDSGDPIEFGEKAIAFYESLDIDPLSKTIVFSDGLDVHEIIRLYKHFGDRINVVFGWGTTLMNDLGPKALNIVMKVTRANGAQAVKFSDVATKHTGDAETLERYADEFSQSIGIRATALAGLSVA